MADGFANEFLLPRIKSPGVPVQPSSLECEVIHLFDQYRDPLFRYVLSFGLPVQDGEEVIQEVFLGLFRHLRKGRSRRNLPGWIFTVAHNLALKQRQLNRRYDQRLGLEEEPALRLSDHSPDPEARVLHQERRELLLRAVQSLPEQDRWCLRLRAEGLRYREIARVLGISLGSVANSLARSLARLLCLDQRL
jgi:RNA polymerase sigma-70 factor, ECF subfamily